MIKELAKPYYGIDAPGLVRFFFTGGFISVLLIFFTQQLFETSGGLKLAISIFLISVATYLIGMGCLMLYWSLKVKVCKRELVLNQIKWHGDEQVLDVGCGRGLMLIGAALHLTTGKAIGIDIWQDKDQSANGPNGAVENARIEGVLEKIEIQTADMRSLPFSENSFDVIVSHWVVHNLDKKADRDLSLAEMVRVLQPNGTLILCDIENRIEYLQKLSELGLIDCRMEYKPATDRILGLVSFGSFRPTTIFARKKA
jgi:arsenite methyltransferase